jgi:serine/threonine protein kinase
VATIPSEAFTIGGLAGEFRLDHLAATGATASIFRGSHLSSRQPAAIKIYHPAESGRAIAEAAVLRRIAYPGIPRVLGVGVRGSPFIAMEWADGQPLRELMEPGGALPLERSVKLMSKVCEVLAHVHEQGIAHLDLKPEHMLVDRNDGVCVVDFGAARPSRSLLSFLTSRERTGTPDYASPEQINGKFAGIRSDVYSIGLVFYELLTGELPFAGVAPNTAVNLRIHRDPLAPREINAKVPAELQGIVCRAMDRNPARRHANARELCVQLDRYLETAAAEPVELFD